MGMGEEVGLLHRPRRVPGPVGRKGGSRKEPTVCSRVALVSEKSKHKTSSRERRAVRMWAPQGSQAVETVCDPTPAGMPGT